MAISPEALHHLGDTSLETLHWMLLEKRLAAAVCEM
jgi:hypothetical protein